LGATVDLPDADWATYFPPPTPPFFVPSSWTTPLPTSDADEADGAESWWDRSGRDDLGLGTCPPMASDIDKPEQSEEPERSPLGRTDNPIATPRPDSKSHDLNRRLARLCFDDMERDACFVYQHMHELGSGDRRLALESIPRIHQRLNDIERAIRAEAAGDA
jgi:hypothetical protein